MNSVGRQHAMLWIYSLIQAEVELHRLEATYLDPVVLQCNTPNLLTKFIQKIKCFPGLHVS